MSHHFCSWLAIVSSENQVAVVARVAFCFPGSEPFKAHTTFYFTAHGAVLSFGALNCNEW